jgi:hypothetical protein
MSEKPKWNDSIEGSESFYRRPHKRMRNLQSFPRTPEPSYSSRRKRSTSTYSGESFEHSDFKISLNDGLSRVSSGVDSELSEEGKELIRIKQMCFNDFVHIERINQKPINVLKGLELHTQVFNTEEQENIVDYVYKLQRMGQGGELRGMYRNLPLLLSSFDPFRMFKSSPVSIC